MLRDQYPKIYENNKIMISLWNTEDIELGYLQNTLDTFINQIFVQTSDIKLDRWEKIVGLPNRPGILTSDRQSTIMAKLRGIGVVNIDQIKRTADAFTNGDVQVIEIPSNYEIQIKFTAVKGIPPNLSDLQNAINQLIPAHLNVTYVYAYSTWDSVDKKSYTWNAIDTLAKTWDQFETL
ncbi:DUF2313 domain-containing protein [Bacillus sp. RG28]|uniref:DUF2313 domain-containing protein n=1 Tax=Gottfriedia endophytica TaxID=2820819 RepID=A0A940NMW6_9BACI|nr:putative phage tail protein [Gottfriedia endophytica]MBP0725526.1 DUF2313 domain-containing protein [Gottfriedia endophytica]